MKIYLIRHCETQGQEPTASLTDNGVKASYELSKFLADFEIELVISSPYKRAIDTITPFINEQTVPMKIDDRLKERILSSENLPDWFEKLKQTYEDRDIKFVGGESSNEATNRILEVVNELLDSGLSSVAIVTHGNILSLLLNHFNREFGFDNWRLLSNPDVFVLESEGDCIVIKHIGKETVQPGSYR